MSLGRIVMQPGPLIRASRVRYRRASLFVLWLPYSGVAARLASWRPTPRGWAELHEEAFRLLGGAPHVVLLDALAATTVDPGIYDPRRNLAYRDVLRHYGVLAIPPRPGHLRAAIPTEASADPRAEPRRFESLAAAQARLDARTEAERRAAGRFLDEQRRLHPLPAARARIYEHARRKVHIDGNVEVAGAFYEAPVAMVGQWITARWDARSVQLWTIGAGTLLRVHGRLRAGRYSPRAPRADDALSRGTAAILARSGTAGAHVGNLCTEIHRREGETGVRAILGVLALARRHGPVPVDRACAEALRRGRTTYRYVRDLVRTARAGSS